MENGKRPAEERERCAMRAASLVRQAGRLTAALSCGLSTPLSIPHSPLHNPRSRFMLPDDRERERERTNPTRPTSPLSYPLDSNAPLHPLKSVGSFWVHRNSLVSQLIARDSQITGWGDHVQ